MFNDVTVTHFPLLVEADISAKNIEIVQCYRRSPSILSKLPGKITITSVLALDSRDTIADVYDCIDGYHRMH